MPNPWLSVPHYKQEHNYSCVAACGRMVLSHFGRVESESDLSQLLETSAIGTPASNISRITSLGFEVEFGPSSLRQLQLALSNDSPPVVFLRTDPLAFWTISDSHAVVLVGIDSSDVYLHDLCFDEAPQKATLGEFHQAWALAGNRAAIIRRLSSS